MLGYAGKGQIYKDKGRIHLPNIRVLTKFVSLDLSNTGYANIIFIIVYWNYYKAYDNCGGIRKGSVDPMCGEKLLSAT